jgi:hypothetical protein
MHVEEEKDSQIDIQSEVYYHQAVDFISASF